MRHAIRRLQHDPGLTLLVTLTLALGVGVNSAIFSFMNSLHRPLPVRNASRLVVLATRHHAGSTGTEGMQYRFTYPAFADFRNQARSYSDLFAFDLGHGGLSAGDQAQEFLFSYVSGNYFSALGLRPAAGRLYTPGEGETPGAGTAVVLGYSYWQKRFGGDPGVVGRQIRINGAPAAIIGVVEERFHGTFANAEMNGYLPLSFLRTPGAERDFFADRSMPRITVMGILKPGIGRPLAETEARVIASRLERQYPETDKGITVAVLPETWARPAPIPALVATAPIVVAISLLLGVLVLGLACMNVGNLLLVRAAGREHEMAVRAALGSGRARLVAHVLAESIVLALMGGAAGLLLGGWAVDGVNAMRLALGNLSVRLDVSLDWRVFTYALALTLAAGIAAGLWPALAASRADLASVLHGSGRGTSAARGSRRFRGALVVAQVAGSLTLLIVAGCFAGGLANARRLNLGFDPRHLGSFIMNTAYAGYDTDRSVAFYRELERRAGTIAGIESASLSSSVPLNYVQDGDTVEVEGQPLSADRRRPLVMFNSITPKYFETMRIELRRGRAFRDSDSADSPRVAVVNEFMARRLWPDQDPLGKRFQLERNHGTWWEVVGVARDGKYFALFEPAMPFFYVPAAQWYYSRRVLEVRSPLPDAVLIDRVEREIRALDPGMPISEARMMEEAVEGVTGFWGFRLGAYMSGVIGLVGMVLAIVGIYGVVSYTARQRTREIGIRIALGAEPRDVLRLVLGRGVVLIACGVVAGAGCAWVLARLLNRFVTSTIEPDPAVSAATAAILAAVAIWACYLPARRATRLDPTAALREE
jgi:predicted permease